ncbi:MAG: hypothetical protein U9Q33_03820 [Campylobacterota bacterium]|nr:hypothetical protein [Campylobacterota bacterium]
MFDIDKVDRDIELFIFDIYVAIQSNLNTKCLTFSTNKKGTFL